MDYMLSGHGSSTGTSQSYKLKNKLVTFCSMGQALDIQTSWTIFDALCTGNVSNVSHLMHTYYPGDTVPMMTLYPTTDFTSGIFKVGNGKIAQRALDNGQFTIKDFSLFYGTSATIYWVACLN